MPKAKKMKKTKRKVTKMAKSHSFKPQKMLSKPDETPPPCLDLVVFSDSKHEAESKSSLEEMPLMTIPAAALSSVSPEIVPYKSPCSSRSKKIKRVGYNPSMRRKIESLAENLCPIPFSPKKSLDLETHECLLTKLGLWEFLHLDFNKMILPGPIQQLVATYSPKRPVTCASYVNGYGISLHRDVMASALRLPKKIIVCEEEDDMHGGFLMLSEEEALFIEDLIWNYIVLQDEESEVPDRVMKFVGVVRERKLEKVDWAGLIYFMVKRELSKGEELRNCYYASHLQLLLEYQNQSERFSFEYHNPLLLDGGSEDVRYLEMGTAVAEGAEEDNEMHMGEEESKGLVEKQEVSDPKRGEIVYTRRKEKANEEIQVGSSNEELMTRNDYLMSQLVCLVPWHEKGETELQSEVMDEGCGSDKEAMEEKNRHVPSGHDDKEDSKRWLKEENCYTEGDQVLDIGTNKEGIVQDTSQESARDSLTNEDTVKVGVNVRPKISEAQPGFQVQKENKVIMGESICISDEYVEEVRYGSMEYDQKPAKESKELVEEEIYETKIGALFDIEDTTMEMQTECSAIFNKTGKEQKEAVWETDGTLVRCRTITSSFMGESPVNEEASEEKNLIEKQKESRVVIVSLSLDEKANKDSKGLVQGLCNVKLDTFLDARQKEDTNKEMQGGYNAVVSGGDDLCTETHNQQIGLVVSRGNDETQFQEQAEVDKSIPMIDDHVFALEKHEALEQVHGNRHVTFGDDGRGNEPAKRWEKEVISDMKCAESLNIVENKADVTVHDINCKNQQPAFALMEESAVHEVVAKPGPQERHEEYVQKHVHSNYMNFASSSFQDAFKKEATCMNDARYEDVDAIQYSIPCPDEQSHDLDLCAEQVEIWASKLKSAANRQCLSSAERIALLEKRLEEQIKINQRYEILRHQEELKRKREISRYERELHLMGSVLIDYRKAMKEMQKSNVTRARQGQQPDEALYRDHPDGNGKVIPVAEWEKLMQERNMRENQHVIIELMKNFHNGLVGKLAEHLLKLDMLCSRLSGCENTLNMLKAEVLGPKNLD